MRKRRLYLFLMVPLLVLAACGSPSTGDGTPQVQVSVGTTSLNVEAGRQGSFTITFTPQGGATGTMTVSQNIELAQSGITVGPLTPWSLSGASAQSRQFSVSTDPGVVPGSYVITLAFSLNGQSVGQARVTVTVRPEGSSGALRGSQLALGFEHGLVIASDGSVWSWGRNVEGQLGLPAGTGSSSTPRQVEGLPADVGVVAVAATELNSYALMENGTIYSWGSNEWGQLGRHAEEGQEHVPGPVALGDDVIEDFTAVYGGDGYSVSAFREDGTMWSWGINNFGQVGAVTTIFYTDTPTEAEVSLAGVEHMEHGFRHVLAWAGDKIWVWGDGNSGKHGTGVVVSIQRQPLEVPIGTQAGVKPVSMAAGGNHSLVAFDDGSVWSWGITTSGVIGRITNGGVPEAVEFPEGSAGVVQVAAGYLHSLALLADGTVWARGSNDFKQLSTGAMSQSARPLQVPLDGLATYIAAGSRFSYAVLEDGTVWAWGDNASGQHGSTDGTGSSGKPTQVRLVWEE